MKKLISLILCVILAVSCAAALAESTPEEDNTVTINMHGAFIIKGSLFEGYKWQLSTESTSSQLVGVFVSDDMTAPVMQLSIALDDSYGEVDRLNDLTDEELKALEATYAIDASVEITYTDGSFRCSAPTARFTINRPRIILPVSLCRRRTGNRNT